MPTSARAVYTVFTKICGEFEIAQMGRCGHRPLQSVMQNRNKLSIPEMSRNGIDAVCPQMRVVHSSEPKAIGKITILRPNRAFRPRSGQKIARVSAQYNASSAPLFSPFFSGKTEKNGPAERQLRCHRINGSPVKPDKWADRDVRPYRVRRKITGGAGGGLAAFNGTSGANRPKRSGQCPLLFTPPPSRGPAAAPAAAQTRRPPPKAQTARRDGWQSPACCGSHSRAPRGRRPEARRA